ncbi:MAG: HAD-IA family hydrolase [Candidatus Binatia bacterium]|nr:HAD-IA family hydrolase [Candidatus Binatia bacterium]
MSARRIRAVFFDAAGTLLTVRGSVGEIYAQLARSYGKEATAAQLEEQFRRCFPSMPALAFPGAAPERIPELERQWWHDLVQQIFAPFGPFPAFAAYFAALFTRFAHPDSWQLYADTEEALHQLRRRGVSVGIISNFDSRLFGILEGLGIASCFDTVIISTRAGAAKPNREIFLQALSALEVRAEEAVHVGDSYDADVVGARAAGLLPVLLERHPRRAAARHDPTIGSLTELPALLDLWA